MKIVIFGASGGIGSELCAQLGDHDVIGLGSGDIDFLSDRSTNGISLFLKLSQPDIVVNAAGVFGDNDADFDSVFSVNVRSNWSIINHYRTNLPQMPKKIIMVGSTAHIGPRKNYALYAASKSALFSLYQSASEIFKSTNVIIGLANPTKVYTNMIKNIEGVDESDCMSAKDAATHLKDFFLHVKESSYINIK